MENVEDIEKVKNALVGDIRQEINEINGLLNVLNIDLDELLELVKTDGSFLESVKMTSKTYQSLITQFKRLIFIPEIGSGDSKD